MKKYIILLLFIFNINAYSAIVNKIEITGNNRISAETIKVYGEIKLKENYQKKDLDQILKNLNSTNFFENINIALENGILKIKVEEYPTISTISFKGEKAEKISEKILELISLKENGSFIKSNLAADVNIIKKIYASLGFNFTEVNPKIEKFSENRVNLFFILDKGKKTKISKIFFIGDKKIKDRRLRDIIVSEENKFWKFLSKNTNLNNENIELDKRLLKNYYKSIGYYDVQVLSSNAEISKNDQTSLTFNINAGNRYIISKISTEVSPVLNKDVFLPLNKSFKKTVGKNYSPFLVTKLLEELDELIVSNDLQFIEHSVGETINEDTIEVKINIFEGSKELIERINIKGNTVTNESVIRSELLLDEGDPFNKLKLDKSISKLKARRIFGSVDKVVLDGTSQNNKIIDIKITEKPTGEISAGAGVGTNGGSIAFNITENNWLGDGIKIASFLNVDQESIKGEIQMTNPNFNYSGNSLTTRLGSTKNDKPDSGFENTIMTAAISTKFEQYNNIYLSPGLDLTFDDLQVQSSGSDALKKQAGSYTDLNMSYGIELDERDRAYMPTDGTIVGFSQILPVVSDSPFLRNNFALSTYNSFGPNVIGVFRFFGANISAVGSEDVRISKRIKMPNQKLRGFEAGKVGPKDGLDFIGGNYATAVNFETQLPNLLPESTKTELGLFLDIGNVWGVDYDSTLGQSSKLRSSVGVNTSWLSPLGPMTFILSQNISKAETDITETFNFRLGTTF
jgi:outer membrane protein insertion porin family